MTGPLLPEGHRFLSHHAGLEAVLFDWDGTLVDSAAATFECYQLLFKSYGIAFDRRRFAETYLPDWHETYRLLGLAEERWAEADSRWLELYSEQRVLPLPHAAAVLARLAGAGLRLGLVTSGDPRRVAREAAALGLDHHLHALVCAGDAPRPKPTPDPLLLALARLEVRPEHAVFVGDSPEDVQMARAAGTGVIGIPGGFPNRDALAASAPDLLAASLTHAADHLLAALSTRRRA